MYKDASKLAINEVVKDFDICIVGAGAAGITIANKLIGSQKKVLLLDSGIETDRGYNPSGGRQSLYKGTMGSFISKVDPDFMTRSRLRMYGGTTNHIEFFTTPLIQPDLDARDGYRKTEWPFDIDELNKYYPEANTYGNFGPFNYDDIKFWETVLEGEAIRPDIEDKLENWIFHANFDEEIHDFQVHHGKKLKASQNVTVLFNANLLYIESNDDNSSVKNLVCSTIEHGKKGREFCVQLGSGGKYILSTGGIEPVRILQLSGNLGDNEQNMLGKGFMLHPVIVEGAKVHFDGPVDDKWVNFYNRQDITLRKDGENYFGVPRKDSQKNDLDFQSWGVLIPKNEVMKNDAIGNFRVWVTFSEDKKSASLGFNWEQIPNEKSTLTLNYKVKDPIFGQPVSHLDWRMLDEDKKTVQKCLDYCIEFFTRHGATDVEVITDLSGGAEDWLYVPHPGAIRTGDHHMGALRMSKDPSEGIVDPNCKIHNVDNLYIAGSAIFPAVGYANPTISIVALSLRLADHLNTI